MAILEEEETLPATLLSQYLAHLLYKATIYSHYRGLEEEETLLAAGVSGFTSTAGDGFAL